MIRRQNVNVNARGTYCRRSQPPESPLIGADELRSQHTSRSGGLDALEQLRKLLYKEQVPEQLERWTEGDA